MIEVLVSAVCVFALTVLLGRPAIELLRRLKFGQSEREDGPQSHLKKQGTPTMGGVFFLLAVAVVGGVVCVWQRDMLPLLMVSVAMGLVGLWDDLVKIKVNKKGLLVWQKSALQAAVTLWYVAWLVFGEGAPYLAHSAGFVWELPCWLYAVLAAVFMYYVTNCVNLTDGVDGLASSTMAAAAAVLAVVFGYGLSDWGAASFSAMITAACLGFLVYNHHPARVFMGDTGSLMLGAAFSALMIRTHSPMLVLLIGFIFVFEGISVMIQVASFKMTGKRVFKMTPIHHHFELSGWSEKKIVLVFTLITLAGAALTAAVIMLT